MWFTGSRILSWPGWVDRVRLRRRWTTVRALALAQASSYHLSFYHLSLMSFPDRRTRFKMSPRDRKWDKCCSTRFCEVTARSGKQKGNEERKTKKWYGTKQRWDIEGGDISFFPGFFFARSYFDIFAIRFNKMLLCCVTRYSIAIPGDRNVHARE